MSMWVSFFVGFGRAARASGLVLLTGFIGLIIAAIPAWKMQQTLESSIGRSLVDETMTRNFDPGWFGEFKAESDSFGLSFGGPDLVGILPMVANVERFIDGALFDVDASVLLAGAAFLMLWALIGGGLIDRFAASDPAHRSPGFMAQCGRFFFSNLTLTAVAICIYLCIFRFGTGRLFDFVDSWTLDWTVEWKVALATEGAYLIVALAIGIVLAVMDYAKVSMVVADSANPIPAFFRGLGFVFGRPFRTLGLYMLLAIVLKASIFGYSLIAPDASQADWETVGLAFLLGLAFFLWRLLVKFWFLAAETHLYQSARSDAESDALAASIRPHETVTPAVES